MANFALGSFQIKRWTMAFAVLPLLAASMAIAQDDPSADPPAEAGRLSWISGTVSIQPVGTQDWGQAYPNLTIGPGDRVFTDSDGRAEIQVGQTYLRIGPNTDVTLVDDTQFAIHFGLSQGSVRVHTFGLWQRQLLDVSTPNGNAEFGQSGDLRADVYPQDGATVFTNLGQFADITGAGQFRQDLGNGQSLQLSGTNPVYSEWLQPASPDDLDFWSQQRDQQIARAASYQYVSPDIPGAADLDANGDWEPQTEYGAIWYPRSVPADWEPYHYGHWVNHAPWGWVWVEDEPWGYAPFHYGRWVSYRGRWGWIPGPVAVRPVYSPALVVFAGGIQFGGGGVSAWFPLGPGEAYRPWYPCSPRYIDQVNITNIRPSSRVHVQNTYVNIVNVTNVTYINQSRGVTAMRHDDFVAGRSGRDVAVRVDARQMEHVRAIDRPQLPSPTQQSIITRPVARPVRVSAQRPTVINQQGQFIAARPGATPVQPPVRPSVPPKPLPGRTVIAAPAHAAPVPPSDRSNAPSQGRQEVNPSQPAQAYPGGQTPRPNPVQPVQPGMRPNTPVEGRPDFRQNQPNQPNQPNAYPGGQQHPAPRPAPPNANQPDRDQNHQQPNMYPAQPRPTPQPVQPTDRPAPPNANQPERNQNQPQNVYPGGQPRPSPQPVQPSERPLPPNMNHQEQNQNRPNEGGRPTMQPPSAPNSRLEYGPPQQSRPNNRQEEPPARPNPQPAPPPVERKAQPAPPAHQEYGPPQGRPNNQHEQQPNKNDNKNQQKSDKNEDKKPHD